MKDLSSQNENSKREIETIQKNWELDEKELQNEFLSDQIAYKIFDEDADLNILKVAEKKVSYLKTKKNGCNLIEN